MPIEVDEDERFEQTWKHLQRLIIAVLSLAVAAGALGLFGPGWVR